MLSYKQRQRYERALLQRFYLLAAEPCANEGEGKVMCWKVSGSTDNVYTITLYHGCRLGCDCPDSQRGLGRHEGLVCKHICFFLKKVLRLPDENMVRYWEFGRLDADDVNRLTARFQGSDGESGWLRDREVVDPERIYLYRSARVIEKEDEGIDTRNTLETDICPICYDVLGQQKCVTCTVCLNSIHRECMQRWLKGCHHPTCVYCRAPWGERVRDDYVNLLEQLRHTSLDERTEAVASLSAHGMLETVD